MESNWSTGRVEFGGDVSSFGELGGSVSSFSPIYIPRKINLFGGRIKTLVGLAYAIIFY